MGWLAGFALGAPHEFCIGGPGKLQKPTGQALPAFLGQPIVLLPFEEHHNRHGMVMPETEVCLEPRDHGARFHTQLELATHRESLIGR